ncbi:methyltransferase [Novosphingobium sp. ZN18A2]|uniref:methyltransferase n=1 Tax=Novosphingobium sp. ZN18A2 TaxID=3079861 RepID=UPI0030D494AD
MTPAPKPAEHPVPALTPEHILQTATGFFAAKTLLTANRFDLFSLLGDGEMTESGIGAATGIQPRGRRDFLDALVALGLLAREGDGPDARYGNTPETATFLDRKSPACIGGFLAMMNDRLYPFWHRLSEALESGELQNEANGGGKPMFETLYEDPARLKQFLEAMEGAQIGNFIALADAFDFSPYSTLADLGGALAPLSRIVAARHPHMKCISLDLPPAEPLARAKVEAAGLSDRVSVGSIDFFTQDFPAADVIAMGNILHDWDETQKRQLIAKAFAALPPGGAFIAIENVIDDARRENVLGLMMSLNMLIETEGGFDYTMADFTGWCRDAGFTRFEKIPLAGAASAAVAWKPG